MKKETKEERLLWEEFDSIVFNRYGVRLLRPEDARKFVLKCKNYSLPIAGIEGFRVYNDCRIQPIQELSTDLGADGFLGDTWEQTLRDLAGPFEPDIWFEIVIV